MSVLQYVNAPVSCLFRLATFVFLRIVPARLGQYIIPSLYVLYLASYPLAVPPKADKTVGTVAKDSNEASRTHARSDFAPSVFNRLLTIILSLPTSVPLLRFANLLLNTALLAAAVDFAIHPLWSTASEVVFSRVGAVYPDAVKITVRYPHQNVTDVNIRIQWRQLKDSPAQQQQWSDGPVVHLSEEHDWIETTKLTDLWPSTSYEYRLAYENRTGLPYPVAPLRFRTFPDPRLNAGSHFRFAVSSCATPNFPYVPFHGQQIKGFDLLAEYLWPRGPSAEVKSTISPSGAKSTEADNEDETSGLDAELTPSKPTNTLADPFTSALDSQHSFSPVPPAEFMMFLGDFIYADVPVYFGDDQESYRRLYRRNFQSASYRKIYERLPVFHVYDDHEIINNFVGLANDSTPPFPNASSAYQLYNAAANYDTPEGGHYYYDFRHGDVAFFVMDTRRYRSDVGQEDPASHTMLGDKQLAALYNWLGKVNNTATFKFIASSVPFTSLWKHDAITDSWAGFSYEKAALLNALHSVPNVIILSGDRHEFAAIEFNAEQGHQIIEVSTSPLSMFYVPFIRTLRMASENVIRRRRVYLDTDQGSRESEEGISFEEVPQERVLKYIAAGNSKWSTFEVDTRDLNRPVVRLEVIVDGTAAYHLHIAGTPVKLQSSTSLGALVPQSFKGVLDRIGLNPSKWF